MATNHPKQKTTVRTLRKMHRDAERIVALTAYDACMAKLADHAGVHILLVGDSLGMTMLGYATTIPVTLEQSLHHTAAVVRGTESALVIGDMPFLTYHRSEEQALVNAGRYLQEAGADGVKLEGGRTMAPTVRRLVDAGIPVLGHVGILPQSILAEGGYRVHGRSEEEAASLRADVLALQEAGAFAIVFEGMPAPLSRQLTTELTIPTIGIGAGPGCSGQIHVAHDILGENPDFRPRHAKQYAPLGQAMMDAIGEYAREVADGRFPGKEQTFE